MAKSKKKYYAIKYGCNCSNVIVTTWEECKKLTHGYNSIYKGFQNKEDAESYLNEEIDIVKVREQKKFAMEKKKKEKAKGTHIGFRVSDEMYQDLEKKSKEKGLKMEDIIKFAINQYLY